MRSVAHGRWGGTDPALSPKPTDLLNWTVKPAMPALPAGSYSDGPSVGMKLHHPLNAMAGFDCIGWQESAGMGGGTQRERPAELVVFRSV